MNEDNAETKGGGTSRGGGEEAFRRDGAMETFASGQLRRVLRRIYGDGGGCNVIPREN